MEEFIYHLFEAVHQVRYKVSVLFHIIFIVGPLKLACSPHPPRPFKSCCPILSSIPPTFKAFQTVSLPSLRQPLSWPNHTPSFLTLKHRFIFRQLRMTFFQKNAMAETNNFSSNVWHNFAKSKIISKCLK